ncbi:hypothetical protein P3S68_006700 [Capsicum galapagoense]
MLGIFDLAMIIIRLLNDGFILDIALEREVEGDLMLGDMGQGFDLVFWTVSSVSQPCRLFGG